MMNSRKRIILFAICFVLLAVLLSTGCNTDLVVDSPYENYRYLHKGQTHVHSSRSDDSSQSPDSVATAYSLYGYTFIGLTDHNPEGVFSASWPSIVNISSAEDGNRSRHHILVIGINTDELDSNVDGNLNGINDLDTCPDENIQPRVDYVLEQGAVCILAHPDDGHDHDIVFDCDNGWAKTEMRTTQGYTGMEIYNGGKDYVGMRDGDATVNEWSWWDYAIIDGVYSEGDVSFVGRKVWGFGGDDCHNTENENSFNRSWIVVNSQKSLDSSSQDEVREDILKNIQAGNFYTVVRQPRRSDVGDGRRGTVGIGPTLRIYVSGRTIRVVTNLRSTIKFQRFGVVQKTSEFSNTSSAEYTVDTSDLYVRVEVFQSVQESGSYVHYAAYSQPLFVGRTSAGDNR